MNSGLVLTCVERTAQSFAIDCDDTFKGAVQIRNPIHKTALELIHIKSGK